MIKEGWICSATEQDAIDLAKAGILIESYDDAMLVYGRCHESGASFDIYAITINGENIEAEKVYG